MLVLVLVLVLESPRASQNAFEYEYEYRVAEYEYENPLGRPYSESVRNLHQNAHRRVFEVFELFEVLASIDLSAAVRVCCPTV